MQQLGGSFDAVYLRVCSVICQLGRANTWGVIGLRGVIRMSCLLGRDSWSGVSFQGAVLPVHRQAPSQSMIAACSKQCSRCAVTCVQDVFEDDSNIHMVMELCTGGSILESIKAGQPQTEADVADIIRCILRFIAQCHTKVQAWTQRNIGMLAALPT